MTRMPFGYVLTFLLLAMAVVLVPARAQEGDDDAAIGAVPVAVDDGGAAPAPASALDLGLDNDEAIDLPPEEIIQRQNAERQRKEAEANQLFVEGKEAFLQSQYERAADLLVRAESLYQEISLDTPRIIEQRNRTSSLLGDTYRSWAEKLKNDAMSMADAQRFERAREALIKAKETDPRLTEEVNQSLADLEKRREQLELQVRLKPENVMPEYETQRKEIFELLEKGRILLGAKRYMRAREQFEKALLEDPYNAEAARLLLTLNEQLGDDGRLRRWQALRERMAEVDWKWVDAVPPAAIEKNEETDITPVSRTGDIRRKLETIIIPQLTFREATIETVIEQLKERSKELDPEAIGINIIYLRAQAGATETEQPTEGTTDDEFGFGGGDEFGGGGDAGFGGGDAGFGGGGADDGFGGFGDDAGGGGFGAEPAAPGAAAPATDQPQTITIEFDHIPLGEAVRYVCQGANLNYRVEPNAVVIADKSVPLETLETRFFRVSPSVLKPKQTRRNVSSIFDEEDDDDDDDDASGEGGVSATEIQQMFHDMGVTFPQGSAMRYEPRVSKLIVTQTASNLRKIEEILRELDEPPLQVTIEAKFMEVRQDYLEELGFQWLFAGKVNRQGQNTNYTQTWSSSSITIPSQAGQDIAAAAGNLQQATRPLSNLDPLFAVNSIIDSIAFDTLVYWFNRRGGKDLLSAPKVTTISGATAIIRMVTERQFPSEFTEPEFVIENGIVVSYTPSTPVFDEARDLGVILTVTPTINSVDKYTIDLELSPEVVEFIEFETQYDTNAVLNGFPIVLKFPLPIIERRQLETRVNVWDGETVVLGGTIKDTIQKRRDKIPFLGDIPGIGRLFRSEGEQSERRNLLIFISARIVNPAGIPLRPQDVRGLPDFRR